MLKKNGRVGQIKLFLLVFVMLRMEPGALSVLDKHCATKQSMSPASKSVCNLKNRIEVVKCLFYMFSRKTNRAKPVIFLDSLANYL